MRFATFAASLKMRKADALYASLALLNDRTDEGRDRSPRQPAQLVRVSVSCASIHRIVAVIFCELAGSKRLTARKLISN
jgi:hypothetical protein